jgi:tetratricopeptide (TPR) repeat protein
MVDFDQDKVPPEKQPGSERPVPEKAKRTPGMYIRERVLIACAVLLIALFGFTAFIARQYHHTIHQYADQWFAKGEAAMNEGQTSAAIDDYRNALVYKPEDPTFQFHLAQALARAGQEVQARTYLTNLLSEDPSSGPINLTLARIAVSEKNNLDAVRYYHSAIYGVWDTDPLKQRWEVRSELCEYLLNHGDVQEAEPDLIALAQEVPMRDVGREKTAGNLLLRAGLWSRALSEFRAVLDRDRRDADALAGAGRASFQLGDYVEAVNYLTRLPRDKRNAADQMQMLRIAQQAQNMNALRPGLRISEQARRAENALSVAKMRIAACDKQRGEPLAAATGAAPDDVQKLYAVMRQNDKAWTFAGLSTHPDQIPSAMSFAFQAEAAATKICGPPQSEADKALSLIASKRAGQAGE